MEETGAPQDLIDEKWQELIEQSEAVYEVLPENYDAVQLYVACYGQFDWLEGAEQRILMGFKRSAIDLEIRLSGLQVSPESWQGFKLLEELTVQMYRK